MKTEKLKLLPDVSRRVNIEEYTTAMLNILEDFSAEKARLEDSQRAMLNLLEDFDMEREKAETVNRELRKAEEEIKKSLLEKEALLKEIHHRVKNNLQVICSMLNLQLPYITDDKAIEIFKESQNRIYSMALIHEKLYLSESLAKIDLSEYIRTLVTNLFLSYGITERSIMPFINIEHVQLGIDKVIPCALIINELVSNSLKHAFPGYKRTDGNGEVHIDMHSDMGDEFMLKVKDNGVGVPAGFEIQRCESLGLKLVSVLVKQLKGDIQIFSEKGTEFIIKFKSI